MTMPMIRCKSATVCLNNVIEGNEQDRQIVNLWAHSAIDYLQNVYSLLYDTGELDTVILIFVQQTIQDKVLVLFFEAKAFCSVFGIKILYVYGHNLSQWRNIFQKNSARFPLCQVFFIEDQCTKRHISPFSSLPILLKLAHLHLRCLRRYQASWQPVHTAHSLC